MKRLDDKKRTVYEVLKKHGTSLGTRELLSFLPKKFAERSVRRWLIELCEARFIEKAGKKRSTKYRLTIFSLNKTHDDDHYSTKESMQVRKVDILRVRYRKQRRELLTEIILQKKSGRRLISSSKKRLRNWFPKMTCHSSSKM